MADRIAERLGDEDLTHVVASPLERAQETARPIADALGLPVATDDRLIEAGNVFQGQTFGVGDGSLRRPDALEAPGQPVPAVVGRAVRRASPSGCSPPSPQPATRPAATRRCW